MNRSKHDSGTITINAINGKAGLLKASVQDKNGISSKGISYQWFADGHPIDGATHSTYKLTSSEASKSITVEAAYTDKSGTTETIISDSSAGIYIPKPTTSLVVDVTDSQYGALGNGKTNDTAAIQKAINYVSEHGGGTVTIPDGNYLINTRSRIRMRDNVTVKMEDDAVLEAIPSDKATHYIFYFVNVENAHVIGGTIIGDRDEHIGGGEWGMGVGIMGSSNITIENLTIKDFLGDGVYIRDTRNNTSEDITLYNVVADNNRRQGISITDGKDIKIINSVFENTNGASPGSGIDIEPNAGKVVSDVDIISSQFLNNAGHGIMLSNRVGTSYREINDITIEGNDVIGNETNITVRGTKGGSITDNHIDGVHSTYHDHGNKYAGIAINKESSGIVVSGNSILTSEDSRRPDVDDQGHHNKVFGNTVVGSEGDITSDSDSSNAAHSSPNNPSPNNPDTSSPEHDKPDTNKPDTNKPENDSPGTITINAIDGKAGLLKASVQDKNGISSKGISYQWFADGHPIDGATHSTYKLTSSEASKSITVEAAYTDKSGTTETIISDSSAGIYIPKPTTSLVVDVTDSQYGALGNGKTNDTAAIQKAINYVSEHGGGTVTIPDGNYLINTRSRIRMRDNVTVKMEDDAVLEAIPSDKATHYIFYFVNVENAHVIGGTIIGDRDEHIGGGEWGMGVGIMGSSNITIENLTIKDFLGDGVYIRDTRNNTSEDITLYNVVADNNRRQGISITDGKDIKIINSVFENTNGASPGSGIDIEPNAGKVVSDVDIISSQFLNNAGHGIMLSNRVGTSYREINDITIEGNDVIGNETNITVRGTKGGSITDNHIDGVHSTYHDHGNKYAGIAINKESSGIVVSGNSILTSEDSRRPDVDDQGHHNKVFGNTIMGTEGNDTLKGSAADEILDGGSGLDYLIGGSGADIFLFDSDLGATNMDTIKDFTSSEGDKIGLSEVIFGDLDRLGNDWFASSSKHIDNDTRIIQKGKDLYFDADGSGSAHAAVQFAEVNYTLAVDDFIIM